MIARPGETHDALSKCAAIGLLLTLILPIVPIGFTPRHSTQITPRLIQQPRASLRPPSLASSSSSPLYDEQIGITFMQTFTSIAYNVTAVVQQESDGYGPAYLLNGLGDNGGWYQVGLTWNWCGPTSGTCANYVAGFNFVYEDWNSSGNSVFPSDGGAGLKQLSGTVNSGDTVLLNLYFSGSNIVMYAKDWNTGASAFETFSAQGSTEFIGLSSTANSNGYFTGLMTEWYHEQAFYSNVERTEYSDPGFAITSATMWMDEFRCSDNSCSTRTSLFDHSSGLLTYTQPDVIKSFVSEGATEYSNAYDFITGPLLVALTLDYSVAGGGSGYSAPLLTYMSNGQSITVPLGTSSTTFELDYDTSWSVSYQLPGSGSDERWYTGQSVAGVALASATLALVYQHQYYLTVIGGDKSGGEGWYDSGIQAEVVSMGAYGRASGQGFRLVAFRIDNGNPVTIAPTVGMFSVGVVMDSPRAVTFTSVMQFQLDLASDAVNSASSLTPPQIAGDIGWYDSGTTVTGVFRFVWNASGSGSRYNLGSLAVDGQQKNIVRAGSGNVSVSVQMTEAHSILLSAVRQYFLNDTGGRVTSVAPDSPTGDGWFDAGSGVSLSAAYSWATTSFASRLNLISYSLDGATTNVSRASSGSYNVTLQMNGAHTVTFNGERQFFISYSFWDSSGNSRLVPDTFEASSTGALQAYNRTSFWADRSGVVTISRIVWGGVDVKPLGGSAQTVSGPGRSSVMLRVYDLKVEVKDAFGLAVTGAQVNVRLSNGSTLSETTGGDGEANLGLVPTGSYQATVSFLGLQSSVNGDASTQPDIRVGVLLSYPIVGVIIVVLLVLVVGALFIRRRTRKVTRALL